MVLGALTAAGKFLGAAAPLLSFGAAVSGGGQRRTLQRAASAAGRTLPGDAGAERRHRRGRPAVCWRARPRAAGSGRQAARGHGPAGLSVAAVPRVRLGRRVV